MQANITIYIYLKTLSILLKLKEYEANNSKANTETKKKTYSIFSPF